MSVNKFYAINKSDETLAKLLKRADELKEEILELRPKHPELWSVIQEKLRVDWTYDSNAIEGSTLTRGETLFFLREGLTVEGKPLKDFLDARNHAEAIDFLFEVIQRKRSISPGLLKEINALLLSGVSHTKARDLDGNPIQKPATPGEYKKLPNHVLQLDGTIHHYVEPLQVPEEIEALCEWIAGDGAELHPAIRGAVAHYNFVRIHPFDDGNGRGARILMNLILMQDQFPPAIIRNEKRRAYIQALSKADDGKLGPFVQFVATSVVETMKTVVEELRKQN